jgi:hypothetical protein
MGVRVLVAVGVEVSVEVAVNVGAGVSVSDHCTVTVGNLQARIIPTINRLIRMIGKRVFFIWSSAISELDFTLLRSCEASHNPSVIRKNSPGTTSARAGYKLILQKRLVNPVCQLGRLLAPSLQFIFQNQT